MAREGIKTNISLFADQKAFSKPHTPLRLNESLVMGKKEELEESLKGYKENINPVMK